MSVTDRHSQPGGEKWTTPGGSQTAAIAVGAQAESITTQSSRLCRVLVTATGTGTTTFYDNASTNSGTVIGVIPANAAVGTVYVFDMPAASGIYAYAASNGAALTVSYY